MPNYQRLRAYADEHGVEYANDAELASNSIIHDYIFGRIELKQSQFTNYEKIKRIVILPRPFSIEEGELTNTLKLRRKVILDRYSEIIDSMYKD